MKNIFLSCVVIVFILFNQAFAADLPSCNDAELKREVSDKINNANTKGEILSPIKLRKIKLLQKYAINFEEVPLKDFNPKEEYKISDKMLELKVNQNYKDEDFKICKSKNKSLKNPIYVLLYKNKSDEMVFEIMNVSGI